MLLNYLKTYISSLLLFCAYFLHGQTPQGITTSVGNYYEIYLCNEDQIEVTIIPSVYATSSTESYTFYRLRSGVASQVIQNGVSNTITLVASQTGIENYHFRDGDKIYGKRVNTGVFPTVEIITDIVTIHVNSAAASPTFNGGVIDQADQLLCPGEIPLDLTVSGSPSSTSFLYQWEESSDNINFTPISGAIFKELVLTSVTTTTFFRRRIQSASGGSCVKYSSSHRVDVSNLDPGVLDSAQNQTICYNSQPLTLESGIGGSDATSDFGSITYQWQSSLDNSTWSTIVSATNVAYTPPPLSQSTYYRRVALNSNANANSCVLATNEVSITVFLPNVTLTSSAYNNTFCSGESITFTASGSDLYEFLINGIVVQSQSSSNTYTSVLSGNSTVTVIATDSSSGCSNSEEIMMYSNEVQAGVISDVHQVCYGESITINSVSAGSVGGVPLAGSGNYQWQKSFDQLSWSDILTANNINYSENTIIQSAYYRRKIINVLNNVSCEEYSNTVFIEVINDIASSPSNPIDQTLCDGNPIQTITYTHSGSISGVNVSGLPNGISYIVNSNNIQIYGTLNVNNDNLQVFNYQLTTTSSVCAISNTRNGKITVLPRPEINDDFIRSNDLIHVSCAGGNDGAIRIPENGTPFNLRIEGNLNHVAQIDQISLVNSPDLSDIYSIEIDGIVYQHTVIPQSFGGAIEDENDVAIKLIDIINSATGSSEAKVVASIQGSSTLLLTAKTPGIPFSVGTVTVTTVSSPTALMQHTPITANFVSRYNYNWVGPNGFTSTDLAIENLEAGAYTLSVRVDNCGVTTATFVLVEPRPLRVTTVYCNESIQVDVEGGVAPYTIRIFDDNNVVVDTQSTNDMRIFQNLTGGANYRIEVLDSQCAQAVQKSIALPFRISFDPLKVRVVDDYCNNDIGKGFIELGGNASGEAFSGGSNQFNYRWTGPNFVATTRDIYNLKPGVYNVTVTDKVLGCEDRQSIEVGSVDPLIIDVEPNLLISSDGTILLPCAGDTSASIQINVTGGLGNYSYIWRRNGNEISGATGSQINNLGVGRYSVTVIDSPPSGIASNLPACQAVREFVVKEPEPLSIYVTSATGSTTFYCPGDTTTTAIDVEIFGGTPPFTVVFTAQNGEVITKTIQDHKKTSITDLKPITQGATYAILVNDSNACESKTTSSSLVFQAVESVTLRPEVQQIDCSNNLLGSIALQVVEGAITRPERVQIQWKSVNVNIYDTWANSNGVLNGIEVGGTYQVIVTQENCELFRADNIQITDVDNSILFLNGIEVNTGGCNGDKGSISLDIGGGVKPIQIQWEKYGILSTSSSDAVNTFGWVHLPQYDNYAIVNELELGSYRAKITDGLNSSENSTCGGTITTDPMVIGSNVFELTNFKISNASGCGTSSDTNSISFNLVNTLPNINNNQYNPEILIDGNNPGTNLIPLGGSNFNITNIREGKHILTIKTGTSSAVLGDFSNCTISHPFEIEPLLPIVYKGETDFEVDSCSSVTQLSIDSSAVTGGTPYVIDGIPYYNYSWQYTPFDDSDIGLSAQNYVGDTVFEAQPGTYELVISDSKNCSSDPIIITLNAISETSLFQVEGALETSTGAGSNTIVKTVKALPPDCRSSQPNGQIGIKISGGLEPYTIEWYKETVAPSSSTQSASVHFIKIQNATNSTHVRNLEPGLYKLIIRSINPDCNNVPSPFNPIVYYEELITVPDNTQLYLLEGPTIIDADLCNGLPGRVYIKVFDATNKPLTFYYNNSIVSLDRGQPSEEGAYILLLDEPVENAELQIVNTLGCSVSKPIIITKIGAPSFRYSSPSLETNGTIAAKEEITFQNTSQLPYSYSVWHFGDGSDERKEYTSGTISPTTHAYGISGTYFVTLRNYNSLGCFEEYSEPIIIGKGYNVIAPNAFSPNGDGINDVFRPLFSGFEKVTFNVYDNRGNILYSETIEEPNPDFISGIKLQGWDGANAPIVPYFIYTFNGFLITDQTEINRSGTFVLIR